MGIGDWSPELRRRAVQTRYSWLTTLHVAHSNDFKLAAQPSDPSFNPFNTEKVFSMVYIYAFLMPNIGFCWEMM